MSPLLLVFTLLAAEPTSDWPGFRGVGDSVARATDLPLKWSDGENVAWTVDLSGYGQSSPVVHGNRIYVTSVEGEMKENLYLSCYDLSTGKRIWQHKSVGAQKVKSSDYVSRGAPTPVVDDEGVYAFFESGDVLALDHRGEVRWSRCLVKDYGEFEGNHGIGSSLAQTGKSLIVLIDHAGPSYLAALAKKDGKNVWKTNRESRTSWSTPIVATATNGDEEILVSSNGSAEGFAADTGHRRWWFTGMKGNTVASPTASEKIVIIGSSEKGQSFAMDRQATGMIEEDKIRWKTSDATSSFASPLIFKERAYFISKTGVAYCLELATGREIWNQRLGDSCWASPIGAGDRIYFFMKNGETVVLAAHADQPQELARNSLSNLGRVYGVAITGNSIVIRGGQKLVRIGKEK